MDFRPATVKVDQAQIEEAIRRLVAAEGYAAGKVTLSAGRAMHNGPDSFSAVVEVGSGERKGG